MEKTVNRGRNATGKYLKIMEEMYVLGEFNGNQIVARNKANRAIPTALKKIGYIKESKYKGVLKWVGDCPKIEDAEVLRRYLANERKPKYEYPKPDNHTITEEQALQVLRNSEKYTYEIYRVETKISRQKLF